MIKQVVSFDSELQVGGIRDFGDSETLEDGEIHGGQARPNQGVATAVSQAGMAVDQGRKCEALQFDVIGLLPSRGVFAVAAGHTIGEIEWNYAIESQWVSPNGYAERLTGCDVDDVAQLPAIRQRALETAGTSLVRNVPDRADDEVLRDVGIARATVRARIDVESGRK